KLSGLTIWPLALAVVLVRAPRLSQKALASLAVFSIALALCGWWFWRNWVLYQDPFGLNVMLDIVGHRRATPADLLREFQ
ncbi:MAG: hypothetical protein NZ765_13635, partial [Anaerolineae bacterium]|nr:hypothetical protein [Anaerolineae bacterium]